MNKITRWALSLILVFAVFFSVVSPAFAAPALPEGVSRDQVAAAIPAADSLVSEAAPALTGNTLYGTLAGVLFSDATLSEILIKIYGALSEQQNTLSRLGIKISPADVSACMGLYPNVAAALAPCAEWGAVDLSGCVWGVADDSGFANALACMLAPFNDILYVILCGGSYRISLLTVTGADGYANSVLPLLGALGCPVIIAPDQFKQRADQNRNSMVYDICYSVLSLAAEFCVSPASTAVRVLPGLTEYINNDELTNSVNSLIEPLKIGIGNLSGIFDVQQVSSLLGLVGDTGDFAAKFRTDFTGMLNSSPALSDIKLAQLDTALIASCKGDDAATFYTLCLWIIDTVKLNKDKFFESQTDLHSELRGLLESYLAKSGDELFVLLIKLLNGSGARPYDVEWREHAFTAAPATYTANLSRENFVKVVEGIDELFDEISVENTGLSLETTLSRRIYSNAVVTALAKAVWSALASSGSSSALSMLGIPSSMNSFADALASYGYTSAAGGLRAAGSWDNVAELNWGFMDGSKDGFERALTAALRPLRPLLEPLLVNGSIKIFGGISIGGTNGYNTAVIPILEALGCPSESVKNYDTYAKGAGTDAIITGLIHPVTALIDKICARPVYTVTQILPNVVFFISNGSLTQCVSNLIKPIEDACNDLGLDLKVLGFDASALTDIDVLGKISDAVPELIEGFALPRPDLSKIAGLGAKTSIDSRRTFKGEFVIAEYVRADQPGEMVTFLRYIVTALKDPANADAIKNFMSSTSSSQSSDDSQPDIFSQFSAGIGDQFADMTVDEVIEWLYKLFFRDRAISSAQSNDYLPTVIYEQRRKPLTLTQIISYIVLPILLAAFFLFLFRHRIRDLIERINAKRGKYRVKVGGTYVDT